MIVNEFKLFYDQYFTACVDFSREPNAEAHISVHGQPGSNSSAPGTEVLFTCKESYVMSGVDTITCQPDGSWTELGTCYPGIVNYFLPV